MKKTEQNYKNHRRIDWSHTGFVLPMFILSIPVACHNLYLNPGWLSVWFVIASLAATLAAFKTRTTALRVQDRLIRLEERLRLEKLLKGPLRKRIPDLKTSQLIAIRFASDKEAPDLVKKALAGMGREDLKRAIRSWRADHLRV